MCEYCEQSFSTKYNLNKHQRQHKFCTKIQGLIKLLSRKEEDILRLSLENHELSKNIKNLTQHISKIERQNLELSIVQRIDREHYDELKQQSDKTNNVLLEKATTKTNHTTNNITLNSILMDKLDPLDHTKEALDEIFEKMTRIHLQMGQKGLAQFVSSEVINKGDNPVYVITDSNRITGSFKNQDKRIVKDAGCIYLARLIAEPCMKRADDIIETEGIRIELFPDGQGSYINNESQGYREMSYLLDDRKVFSKELAKHVQHV